MFDNLQLDDINVGGSRRFAYGGEVEGQELFEDQEDDEEEDSIVAREICSLNIGVKYD